MRRYGGVVVLWCLAAVLAPAEDVPALLAKLKSKDLLNRREAAIELGQLAEQKKLGAAEKDVVNALKAALRDPDERVKQNAASALGRVGRAANDAIGDLLTVLVKDEKARAQAGDALAKLGRPAVIGLSRFLIQDQDKNVRIACAKALREIGADAEEALPQLQQALKDAEVAVRRDAAVTLGFFGPRSKGAVVALIELLDDKDQNVRIAAIDTLGQIGPDANRAIRSLRELMLGNNATLAQRATSALIKMGEEGQGVVLPLLTSNDANQRLQVYRIITAASPLDPIFLPYIVKGLTDANAEIRKLSAAAVGKVGADPKVLPDLLAVSSPDPKVNAVLQATVRKLLDAVGKAGIPVYIQIVEKHSDAKVRLRAVLELGQLGKDALSAVPVLQAAVFKDSSEDVRKAAADVLENLGVSVVKLIGKQLDSPDANDRAFAMATLADLGEKAEPALEQVARALKSDPDPKVRRNAVFVLKGIGKKALPHLEPALSDKEAVIRADAVEVLLAIGADDPKTVPLLIRALRDENLAVRSAAAIGAGMLGPKAAEAAPALIANLKEKDEVLRKNAGLALGRIGPAAGEPLIAALRNKDPEVRHLAIVALQDLRERPASVLAALVVVVQEKEEPNEKVRQVAVAMLRELRRDFKQPNPPLSKEALPALVAALKDSDATVRADAAFALGEFIKDDGIKTAIAPLFEALRDKDEGVRASAADTLSRIGTPAVDVLVAGLRNKEKEKDVRKLSAESLGRMGKLAKNAEPALQAATEDPDEDVREAAKLALARIK